MPSIRSFSWGRNVFLAYCQEPQSIGGGMQWTRSRQDISKERLTQDASGWRVWAWYGQLGLAFILFDANYEEFIGFPAPGVSPRAGVRASF